MKILYRKTDRAIVGHVFPRRTEKDDIRALSVELENILNSELGGKAGDYDYLEVPESILAPGLELQINDDLQVVTKESQQTVDRRSAINKLRALGLTDAEISAIA